MAGGGASAVIVAPYAIKLAGFTQAGVAAGSFAAWTMSWFGGTVPAWFAVLQSAGAAGIGVGGNAALAGVGVAVMQAATKLGCTNDVEVCCQDEENCKN